MQQSNTRGYLSALIGDGRPLIMLTALCLALSGGFAIFQSISGEFLPHDTAYLQMSRQDLCNINECRIVHFMFHDRVSFGGSLIAIAAVYLWLAEFPLRAGQRWAWWTLVASGVTGFGSFLTYLGYGYLDTWHGVATLFLLPCFIGGLWLTRRRLKDTGDPAGSTWSAILGPSAEPPWISRAGVGRALFLFATVMMIAAGFVIQTIGMTSVFVPTDLTFMGLTHAQLDAINPRLVPLIAHDRAWFGGAVATAGLLAACCAWWGAPSKSLRQALLLGGIAGWSTAIGVHPIIGYTDAIHVLPATATAALYFAGLALMSTGTRLRAGGLAVI
jgi:hypothetical protein